MKVQSGFTAATVSPFTTVSSATKMSSSLDTATPSATVSPLSASPISSSSTLSPLGGSTSSQKPPTNRRRQPKPSASSSSSATPSSSIPDPIKRARRTAIERRSRQQRHVRIQLLQDEVASLTNILENLTLPKRLQEDARALLHDFGLVPVHVPPPRALIKKMDALFTEMRLLEREHHQLQQTLYTYQNANAVIRDLVTQPAPDDWRMNVKKWDAISHEFFQPWTMEQCGEIMDECMKTITRFALSDDFVSSGFSLNGWVDRTRFEASTSSMEFSFYKDLPHVDPRHQFEKYWKVFLHEEEYRRALLGLRCKYHMHVLQRVSEDIIIFRQDIKYPMLDTTCHHISINFRKRTPEGYLLCMRTIPVPKVQEAMPDVIWTQNFHWNHADEVRDHQGNVTGTRSIACGSISSENAEYAALWVMEAAITVLRVESALISPLLMPQ